jgi:RNA polymerase sigma-70 factor (ECF subfamily)
MMRGKRKMSTQRMSERQWTRLVQGADTRVASSADLELEAAFEEHWPAVCRTLYTLVGDWSEAEDLALEAFWRLYKRPPRDLRNVGGWLYRVATNLGLNALRARKRRQRHEEEAGALRLQRRDVLSPSEEVERRETRERVRHILAQMRPRAARMLILRYADYAYAEIADMVGVAPGSVGTLLARAERDFERRYRALEDRL